MTESGNLQLSYSAASTRYTKSTHIAKIIVAVFPTRFSWKAKSVHSMPMPEGKTSAAIFSIASIACPVLYPGARFPVTSAAGYRLYLATLSGPIVRRMLATDPSGTFTPRTFGTFRL